MKVCLIQMNVQDDKQDNLERARRLMAQAIESERPRLLVLPELFTFMGGMPEDARAAAERFLEGAGYQMLKEVARDNGVFVHGGSMIEQDGDDFFNTTVVFDPAGEEIARYRKIHLFDIVTPDGVSYRESDVFTRGNDIVTFGIDDVTVGCTICYDIRFAELYIPLAKSGSRIIVIPAAFTLLTGKDHWEVLVRARAIETQCYVLAPNQIGTYVEEGIERANYGNSLIVDPWGKVISRAQDQEGIVSATLDFNYQTLTRQDLPAQTHRVL